MLRTLILTTALALPTLALPTLANAKGSDEPPKQTQTTKDCFQARQWDPEIGKWVRFSQPVNGVWDANIRKCIRPDRTGYLGEDTLYKAVRELAYAGRYDDAITVLDQMPNQASDQVMTYRGFTARKLGKLAEAEAYYQEAIALNPDNILARSYMGQGYVTAGKTDAARAQLDEIVARGGTGTWSEVSLRRAIESGTTYSY
ncbi:MAG: tetratricopeptide repeat protein [Pseudomonadota bacterium]